MKVTKIITHPSVQASGVAGGVFALLEVVVTDIPLWLWGIWAALTVVSVVQAVRAQGDA